MIWGGGEEKKKGGIENTLNVRQIGSGKSAAAAKPKGLTSFARISTPVTSRPSDLQGGFQGLTVSS